MKATVGRTNPVLAFERSTVKDEVSSLSKPDDIYGPPFLYDPGTYGLSFLLKWQGTILPLVFTSPLFWGLQTMHGLLLAMYWHFGEDEPALDWKAAVIPSSLLTFLLVSYSNQCFARYFQLYQHCTGLHSAVMDWAVLLKLEFGHMDTAFQWNCLRLLLGALQVHYALLGGDDVDEHGRLCKGVSTDEWRAIRTRNLLTRAEIERLQDYAGFIPCLPIGWALAEIKGGVLGVDAPGAIESSHELLGPKRVLLNQFGAIAGRFRDHSMSTFDILNAPVPFAYFHVMKLLLLLSLLIISYALIELLHGEVVMSFTIFFLMCLVMVGLSEIAIVRASLLCPRSCCSSCCSPCAAALLTFHDRRSALVVAVLRLCRIPLATIRQTSTSPPSSPAFTTTPSAISSTEAAPRGQTRPQGCRMACSIRSTHSTTA